MWKNLKVGTKLCFCVLPLFLIIALSALDSIRTLRNAQKVTKHLNMYESLEERFLVRAVDHLAWAQQLVLYVALQKTGDMKLETDPARCSFGKWYFSAERQNTEAMVPGMASLMRRVEDPHARLHESAVLIRQAADADDLARAQAVLSEQAQSALNDVLSLLNQSKDLIGQEKVGLIALSDEENRLAVRNNWAALALGLSLALLCFFALLRSILRPLGLLTEYTKAVEAGDRNAKLEVYRTDQFGMLAVSLRSLMTNLNKELAFSQSMLQGLPMAAGIYNTDNRLVYANARMLELLELDGKAEQYYGKTSGDFLFREPDRVTASVRCIRDKQPVDLEVELVTYKKNIKHVLTQAAPLMNDKDEVISVLSMWTDTTEMHNRQVEISRARDAMLQVASKAQVVAENVAGASQDLSVRISQASTGAEQQRDAVQNTAAAINQMNNSIAEITNGAADAASVSQRSMGRAQDGEELVRRVLDSMQQLEVQSRSISSGMEDLRQHADGVGHVINVISDIADQINLLALNAAIEAARAGDAGRGFAVVADSVRTLAEKTMNATKDVVRVIENIQNGAKSNADMVDKAVEAIHGTAEMAGHSGEALSDIVELSRAAASQVNGIAQAASEQAEACETITQTINEASAIVSDTAEAMVSASQSTEQLAQQSTTLRGLVEELK